MTVWFTADTHFGHGNIIKYCNRPFTTPEEKALIAHDPRGKYRISPQSIERHDAAILDAINSRVQHDDMLWIIGDFCWGKLVEATTYRSRIACRNVHLVWGNHDHRSIRPVFTDAIEQGMITINDQDIWLNHYPIRSWNQAFDEAWHLYGHVHGRLTAEDERNSSSLTKDVGVDACEYRPWSFEELAVYMRPRVAQFRAQKERYLQGNADALVM